MQKIRGFLTPNWRRLTLLAIFLLIAAGGCIQAWAFSDIPPKPPLYDFLRPFPIWPIWMILLVPLALFSLPLRLIGIDLMGGPSWLFTVANVIYFYLLACFISGSIDWLRHVLSLRKASDA